MVAVVMVVAPRTVRPLTFKLVEVTDVPAAPASLIRPSAKILVEVIEDPAAPLRVSAPEAVKLVVVTDDPVPPFKLIMLETYKLVLVAEVLVRDVKIAVDGVSNPIGELLIVPPLIVSVSTTKASVTELVGSNKVPKT